MYCKNVESFCKNSTEQTGTLMAYCHIRSAVLQGQSGLGAFKGVKPTFSTYWSLEERYMDTCQVD